LEKRISKRAFQQEQRKQKEQRKREYEAVGKISEDTDGELPNSLKPIHRRPAGTSSGRKRRSKVVNTVTIELASALDRTKVSDRNTTYIQSAAAKSLGYDPRHLTLNKESVRLARRQYREEITSDISNTFFT